MNLHLNGQAQLSEDAVNLPLNGQAPLSEDAVNLHLKSTAVGWSKYISLFPAAQETGSGFNPRAENPRSSTDLHQQNPSGMLFG